MRFRAPTLTPGHVALVVALLALLLRLLVVTTLFGDRFYYSDEENYFREAERMAAGNWLGTTTFYAPGMVYFLAGGLAAGFDQAGLRFLQALLGAGAVLLTVLLGTHLFGLRVGVLAGMVAAVYPYFLYLPGVFFAQNIVMPVLLATVLALYLRQAGGRAAWALAGGAGLGLSGIFMPPTLILAPAFALWHASRQGGGRRGYLDLGLMTLAGLLVLAPVTARNAALTGRFIPVASMGGRALYWANNPELDPRDRDAERWIELNVTRVEQERRERRWTEAQMDSALTARAWTFISEDPGRFVHRFGVRVGTLWSFMPNPFTENPHTASATFLAAALSSAPVLLLGLGGLLLFAGRWRILFPLYATPLLLTVVLSCFHTTVRYRLTFEPALLILAAAFLVRLLRPRAVGGRVGHGLAVRVADPSLT
jgi:4-amino-4-deoxy-L-arabinose transferase-like glycosyltransferase